MHIIVIIHNIINTGPYFKVFEMCQSLSDLGNDITLLCTSKKSRLKHVMIKYHGVIVVESPDLLWGKWRQGLDLWNIINRLAFVIGKKYDLIQAIDCRPVVIFPALYLKYVKKVPLVISWWDIFGKGGSSKYRSNNFYNKYFSFMETIFDESFRKYADKSIVVTEYLREKLISLKFASQNISVLKIGCYISKHIEIDKISLRKKLNLTDNNLIVCFVGNIFPQDYHFMLDCLYLLKNRNILPLTILIGNHKINDIVAKDLNIINTGFVNSLELKMYLQVSDYGLIPFKINNANLARWPSKISDYVSEGLPLIATPISDLKNIFIKYDIGFIAKDDSVNEYVAAIEAALSNLDLRYKSHEALRFAQTELDWNIITNNLMIIYNQLTQVDR